MARCHQDIDIYMVKTQNSFIIDKLDVIKTKILCSMKDYVKRKKRHYRLGEIFCRSHIQQRIRIYKELSKFNIKKMNSPVRKWAKDIHRHFTQEDIQMTSKPTKDVQLH